MTTAVLELAEPGLLTALAIAYDKAGVRDRALRLAHASEFVGRPLATTGELTRDEALELRRQLQRGGPARCNLDGRLLSDHDRTVIAQFGAELTQRAATSTSTATCSCVDGGSPGIPSPCDPAGSGRYCPPAICWCGSCPWWVPAPAPNYAAAVAKLAEAGAR